jgi:heat shock transcription factor
MSARKRRAPGASPQAQMPTYQQDTNMTTDQYMNWTDPSVGADIQSFNDPTLYDYGNGMGGHNRVVSLDAADEDADMNQGQLVRRNPNQQLAPRRGQWDGYPSPTQQQWETMDDEDELEQKVAIAKKDAQSKRKQIPPFVQKLSRYVLL